MNRVDKFCDVVIDFLEDSKVPYLVIGGVAVSLIGEPRMTQDIDLIISIRKQDVRHFLEAAAANGFELNIKEKMQRIKRTGTFRLNRDSFHADIIIASIPLEDSAFERAQRLTFVNRTAFFPSPEDLILFKIIVGRDKDMLDAKSVVIRHRPELDQDYLKKWAQAISDEAEDMNIWNRLMKALEE